MQTASLSPAILGAPTCHVHEKVPVSISIKVLQPLLPTGKQDNGSCKGILEKEELFESGSCWRILTPHDDLSTLFFVLNVENILRHLQVNVQNHAPSSKEASLPL